MTDWQKIRDEFPTLKREINGKPIAYLDNAATNLKPQPVVDVIERHYADEASNVHRGVHTLSVEATDAYEKARSTVVEFINAKSDREVIFTSGTTASLNLIAMSYGETFLKEGDEILISQMEHHSNIVPWQILCEKKGCVLKVAPINSLGEIIWEDFKKLVNKNTKLISVNYISNSIGTRNPVEKIIEIGHSVGAVVSIDGAQAVAHSELDVQALDCDFFSFSAHKLVGPTGIGVLYGKEDLLEKMPPVLGGGDMISEVTFEKSTWNVLPFKFEAGTPHIGGVLGMAAGIDYVKNIGLKNISDREQDLLQYAVSKMKEIEGLQFFGEASEKAAIISFGFKGVHPSDLGTIMDQYGVAVRTGHHCTQPLMKFFGVPGTTRASFSFYNNENDVDRLIEAIKKAKEFLL
ncbi:MAG: cysteine desulfurase [Bdellovibrionales bacterium]